MKKLVSFLGFIAFLGCCLNSQAQHVLYCMPGEYTIEYVCKYTHTSSGSCNADFYDVTFYLTNHSDKTYSFTNWNVHRKRYQCDNPSTYNDHFNISNFSLKPGEVKKGYVTTAVKEDRGCPDNWGWSIR